jgi:hypothetical protein
MEQQKQKPASVALIKVKEVKHPISEATIGFRIQAAHPNKAGRNRKGEAIPAFRKPYLIAESSDFSAMVDEEQYLRFCADLRKLHGYTDFPIVAVPKMG